MTLNAGVSALLSNPQWSEFFNYKSSEFTLGSFWMAKESVPVVTLYIKG